LFPGSTDHQYHRTKARAQELQAQKEAEIKREIAAKKEKEVAAAKEAEAVCPPYGQS